MWTEFHRIRITILPKMWSGLFEQLDMSKKCSGYAPIDPEGGAVLSQHVNSFVFDKIVHELFQLSTDETPIPSITKNEEKALRYAAGYVPFSLCKQLSDRPEFQQSLKALAVEGKPASYMEYTTQWIDAVDRGALFKISDEAYHFFYELEINTRKQLHHIFSCIPRESIATPTAKTIAEEVSSDEDVMFMWTVLTSDLDEEQRSELLQHVALKWITIRGFSAAGAWMEYYKQANEQTTKKSHSLRKSLSRKRKANTSTHDHIQQEYEGAVACDFNEMMDCNDELELDEFSLNES